MSICCKLWVHKPFVKWGKRHKYGLHFGYSKIWFNWSNYIGVIGDIWYIHPYILAVPHLYRDNCDCHGDTLEIFIDTDDIYLHCPTLRKINKERKKERKKRKEKKMVARRWIINNLANSTGEPSVDPTVEHLVFKTLTWFLLSDVRAKYAYYW